MRILAVDTSCDETAAAVVENTTILSNVVWSQIKLHKEFGGVMPSVARLAHEEHIDETIEKALQRAQTKITDIDAFAVTQGSGLAIALEVGINKVKELAREFNKPLIAVNHIEGHVLSPLSKTQNSKLKIQINFPCVAIVVSGKHTDVIYIEKIGKYKIIAETQDDALGEALDKAARMVGLGYPGGAVLEKMAKLGNPKRFQLPLPMAGREDQNAFSYSGLKAAMYRLVAAQQPLDKQKIYDLAACFQNRAFDHVIRVAQNSLLPYQVDDLLVGGGVIANVELRKRVRSLARELNLRCHFPINKKLCGDNAAMIGIAAAFKFERGEVYQPNEEDKIDRLPRWRVDQ